MHTIRLRVNNTIYNNLMWLLNKFKKDEIEIITEDEQYVSIQTYLQNTLNQIDNENVFFDSITELDKKLEDRIKKHEN